MSRQKHDLGRIKKSNPATRPRKAKADRKKEKSRRVAENYARAEARYNQLESQRRDKERGNT